MLILEFQSFLICLKQVIFKNGFYHKTFKTSKLFRKIFTWEKTLKETLYISQWFIKSKLHWYRLLLRDKTWLSESHHICPYIVLHYHSESCRESTFATSTKVHPHLYDVNHQSSYAVDNLLRKLVFMSEK